MGQTQDIHSEYLGAFNMVVSTTSGQHSSRSNSESILTFDGKKYAIDTLPQETQELIRGVRVADSQLKFHEDTLKVIALGRQALALKLKANLESATAITP